jgi:catechol 2,3-dioxygenase-like lactoylglutathione lyase family enzyme
VACRFTELVIDCHDHTRLGRFWSAVLGYDVSDRSDGPDEFYVQLQGPETAGPTILLVRTPDVKTVKNRLHIDVNPTDRDQDAELERLLALGATPADVGQTGDEPWHVLADPEGNEFCLLRRRLDPL